MSTEDEDANIVQIDPDDGGPVDAEHVRAVAMMDEGLPPARRFGGGAAQMQTPGQSDFLEEAELSKESEWDRDMAVFDNPHKIAVYKNHPGNYAGSTNYVKHYFAKGDPLETPDAIGEVRWFDGSQADEASEFWRTKEDELEN